MAVVVCAMLAVAATDAAAAPMRASNPPQRRVVLLALPQRGNPSRFATQVSNPSSPLYRRFLSLGQYDQRFASGVADRRRVLRYLRSPARRESVQVSGDRSVILAVVTPRAGQRLFCAKGAAQPTRGLCKPRAIRRSVRQISVGEVYQLTGGSQRSRGPPCRRANARQSCAAATKNGEFTPQQLSTAYGVDPLRARRLSGAGVRVATLSSQEVDTSGFQTWGRCFHLRAPVVRQFAMPGASRDTATAPEETVLDIEALASLAPGLQRITPIFVPLDQSFTNSFLLFMFGALDPSRQGGRLPDILSISDGVCESRFTRDQLALGQRLLAEAAALGITTLAASGDLGFQGCFINRPGSLFPSSSPFTTSVGGTSLTLTPGNQIASQVVWSTFATEPDQGVGTGGGPSKVWGRPGSSGLRASAPSSSAASRRGLPPTSARWPRSRPASPCSTRTAAAGGSAGERAPRRRSRPRSSRWSSSRSERPGGRASGSLPPLLYQLARGPNYHSIFFDITSGTSSRHPNSALGKSPAGGAAQPGYDLATGLGSLNAAAFARAVASLPANRKQ